MKYTKYDKLIDESYPEERKAVYEKLKKELGLPDDDAISAPAESRSATAAEKQTAKPAQKRRLSFKNFFKQPARLAACVSLATAVVCLAIILPFTLNRGSGLQATTPTPPQTSASTNRFIKAEECEKIEIEYSIKEYSELNKLSLLYVDWYDIAEIKTSLHIDNEDSTDVVFYEEILVHKGTGSIAELYITDLNTKIDKVENYKKVSEYQYVPIRPTVKVYWGCDMLENGESYTYTAYFTFTKYEYTLVLRYPLDENSIFELIDSMLPAYK